MAERGFEAPDFGPAPGLRRLRGWGENGHFVTKRLIIAVA
jgi:hypothetical protein